MRNPILLLFYISNSLSIIILPFKKHNPELKKEKDFLEIFLNNNIILDLKIGTPMKTIPIKISLNSHYFFLYGSELNGLYNEKESSSYKNNSDYQIEFQDEYFNIGFVSSEKLIFKNEKKKNIEYDNINFILASKNNPSKINTLNGEIGLTILSNSKIQKGNIIYFLKLNNIIQSYIFYITYNNENGEIFIGDSPENYDKTYSKDYYKFIPIENMAHSKFNWIIQIDKIYFGNEFIINKIVSINFNIEGLILNLDFMKIIEDGFFNKLINENKCFKLDEKINNEIFYYFYCVNGIDVSNFKKVILFNKAINYNFTFDSKDLFIKKNKQLFFMIIFSSFNKLTLGEVFNKKYNTLFDQERKLIGFYFGKKSSFSFYWFFIFILFIIVIFLSYFLYKNIKNRKLKIKANELEDNFSYIPDFKIMK